MHTLNARSYEKFHASADFGFARFLGEGAMAGTLCGSPLYMAPEVIVGQKYEAKADLWSIGTIIFHCLTGNPPFSAKCPSELKLKYERHPRQVPNIPAHTSSALRDLILRLLKLNAKERIDFQDFFKHPFLHEPSPPVAMPGTPNESEPALARSPLNQAISVSPLSSRMSVTPPRRPSHRAPQTPRMSHKPPLPEPIEGSAHEEAEECDGFVIVAESGTGAGVCFSGFTCTSRVT